MTHTENNCGSSTDKSGLD